MSRALGLCFFLLENLSLVHNYFTTEPTESTEEKPQGGFSIGRVREY
jgi:hypothetical protein